LHRDHFLAIKSEEDFTVISLSPTTTLSWLRKAGRASERASQRGSTSSEYGRTINNAAVGAEPIALASTAHLLLLLLTGIPPEISTAGEGERGRKREPQGRDDGRSVGSSNPRKEGKLSVLSDQSFNVQNGLFAFFVEPLQYIMHMRCTYFSVAFPTLHSMSVYAQHFAHLKTLELPGWLVCSLAGWFAGARARPIPLWRIPPSVRGDVGKTPVVYSPPARAESISLGQALNRAVVRGGLLCSVGMSQPEHECAHSKTL